ncbi:MAG: acetolactate synthase small subunit [Vicinamibacterales bacterium]
MTAHTFVVTVEDEPGVLNRVASLFRRRNYNIDSLTVGRTEQAGVSRMTIVVPTDEPGAHRVAANLYKLVNVISVQDITNSPAVFRDLAMIKVAATPAERPGLVHLVDVFRARIIDLAPDSLTIEITGAEDKIDGLLEVLKPYGVLEMARTGRVAMARGVKSPGAAGVTAVQPEATDSNVSYSV